MKQKWAAFIARTVWAPDQLRNPEDVRVRVLIQKVLPLIDIILILVGGAAFFAGLPAFEEYYVAAASAVFGVAVAVLAGAALVGLAFHVRKLESISKIALTPILVIYPATLLVFGTLDASRIAAGLMCAIVIPILWWRVGDLGRQGGLAE